MCVCMCVISVCACVCVCQWCVCGTRVRRRLESCVARVKVTGGEKNNIQIRKGRWREVK